MDDLYLPGIVVQVRQLPFVLKTFLKSLTTVFLVT